jgi:putative membrane protein
MIIYERKTWLSLVLRVHGSVVKRVWPRILVATVIAIVFTYLQRYPTFHLSLTVTPFLITGLPLGIILGFRNSSSYDRFWEGRKLWGALVNSSRTWARQVEAWVAPNPRADHAANAKSREAPAEDEAAISAFRRDLVCRQVAFVHAMRMLLRRETDWDELREFLPQDELTALRDEASPPAAILHGLGQQLARANAKGWLRTRHVSMLEGTLTSLTDILGGCERIKNTPTPLSYLIFIHRAVAVYAVLLPFGLADTIHALTPLVVFFISYAFFSLDAIGDELDDPFQSSDNTLPIATLARNIEIYAKRRLGDTNLPKPLTAKDGVLH